MAVRAERGRVAYPVDARYAPRGMLRLFGPFLGRIIRQGPRKDLATFAAQLTGR